MIKFFKSIYMALFFAPTVFQLTLYKKDNDLDKVIEVGLMSGIKSVKFVDGFHILKLYLVVEFKSGGFAKLWNKNFPYAWLSEGTYSVEVACGDRTAKEFANRRVRRSTARKLRRAIYDYFISR